MTIPPQQRKSRPSALFGMAFLGVAAMVLGYGVIIPDRVLASPDDRLVVNADTGLAISGFDPVAYFTRKQAVLGRPEFELTQNRAVWRFLNEGNRAAFAANPQVYTPRFGGYDPMAVDRGVSVAGNPLIWVVAGERLYLFYDDKARAAFLVDPGRFIASATRRWPAVAGTIGR